MRWQIATACVLIWLSPHAARAQSGANITLQLPSFSQFGVDTTVIVPDGGAAAFAGDRAAATGRGRFGGNRAIGMASRSSQSGVTARVHDPRQAEAALRAAAARGASGDTGTAAERAFVGRRVDDGSPLSAAELAQRRSAQGAATDQKARALFEKGRLAQAAGKHALAATYYRTSAGQASESLRGEINAQWRTLFASRAEAGQGKPTVGEK
jgi:hypothetical protein